VTPKPVHIEGNVRRSPVDIGSKSERAAVVLETGAGHSYILRRRGGPAFGDTVLDDLVGQSIAAHGISQGQLLIMDDWRQTD